MTQNKIISWIKNAGVRMPNKLIPVGIGLMLVIGAFFSASCDDVAPTPTLIPDVPENPDISPTELPLPMPTYTPIESPAPSLELPTTAPVIPTREAPLWIAYCYDGDLETSSDNGCRPEEEGITISNDLNTLSFYRDRSSRIGMYGVCRKISSEETKFRISVDQRMTAARFLVMLAPAPKFRQKKSVGFRFQPELFDKNEQGMVVKALEYKVDYYETDRGAIRAIEEWHAGGKWSFDFLVTLRGTQSKFSINKKALQREWPINFSERYLCFGYQQLLQNDITSALDVSVTFP